MKEPYVKENNLLQLSLYYFGKGRPERTSVTWLDKKGTYKLECICKYGVPGSFEQDVYTACTRIWVRQDMPEDGITLNYSDIARELRLKPKDAVGRIKESLKKLAQARYEFTRCFLLVKNGKPEEVSTHFSLFDSASLFEYKKDTSKGKRNSESKLIFPKEIRKNLEAKYYQRLDMAWYRALPEGLGRRLYEYLQKRRYHSVNGVFAISEEALCRWLPITDKHTTQRRNRLATLANALIVARFLLDYEFNKKKKQCVFTYRDPLPDPPEKPVSYPLEDTMLLSDSKYQEEKDSSSQESQKQEITSDMQLNYSEALEWISSIRYFHKKKKKEIATLPIPQVAELYPIIREEYEKMSDAGNDPGADWVYRAFMRGESPKTTTPKDPSSQKRVPEIPQAKDNLESLLNLMKIKRRTKRLERIVAEYYESKGFDYVKWHILYANDHAKKNYSTFLQKALAENWAEEWQEETEEKVVWAQKVEEEKRRKAEQERQEEEEAKRAQEQRPAFIERVKEIDSQVKQQLWEEADHNTPENLASRETNVKIQYASLLLQFLIDEGEDFSDALLTRLDFGFINQVVEDVER